MKADNEARAATQNDGKTKTGGKASIRIIGALAIAVAILIAFFAFTLAGRLASVSETAEANEARYIQCNDAIDNLQTASDYLTTQARLFVTTGREECMNAYIEEITVVNRRGHSVDVLKSSFSGDQEAVGKLEDALVSSDDLAKSELAAMRLAADYYHIENLPAYITNAQVDAALMDLKGDQKLAAAENLVLGKEYDDAKQTIRANVDASSKALLETLNSEMAAGNALMQSLLFQLRVAVALLLCVVMVLVLVLFMYVLKPLDNYIKQIRKSEPLEVDGSYELQYLASAYNSMYEDNNKRIEQLREFAERDALTGISNRNGYDSFLATHTRNIALLLIDIDDFKEFNTVYGRDTGDAVMVKLANALCTAFRSTDFPCRIGSDLFAVIMTNTTPDLREAVSSKIALVNTLLADDSDDLPLITLSVGAAFSAEGMDDNDIYLAADDALKRVQKRGKNGLAFYGDHVQE